MSWMSSKVGPNDTKYTPVNGEKYMGKTRFAVCRSSWEISMCRWLDANQGVLQWKSEPFGIPYIDPSQRDKKGQPKRRNYYPDYIAKIQSKRGGVQIWLIEVKPFNQTIPPRKGRKSQKTQLYEARTYEINQAKWRAAKAYCNSKGWLFKIITEKELLIK